MGKVLSPSARRECVDRVINKLGVSERQACAVIKQSRSTQRRAPIRRDDEDALTQAIIRLACMYGRYGYRRITALLHGEGWMVNHKRVARIWRREGLKVPMKQPRRGRLWLNDGSCMHLDEFGMLMEAMMDARGAHYMKAASKALTELYSSSENIFLGGSYADGKKEKVRIPFPNLCIYACSTPDKYSDNLNKDAIASGELNRFIVLRAKNDMPVRNRYAQSCGASEHVISGWSNLYPGIKVNSAVMVPEVICVSWTGLDDRIWEMGLFEDEKIVGNRTSGALWGRYRENCIKIAMIFAITRNPLVPVISNDDLDISEAIVRSAIQYTECFIDNFGRNVFSRLTEEIRQKIAEFPSGCPRTDISLAFKHHKKKEVNESLDWLIEAGKIEAKKISTKGRSLTIYIIIKDGEG